MFGAFFDKWPKEMETRKNDEVEDTMEKGEKEIEQC